MTEPLTDPAASRPVYRADCFRVPEVADADMAAMMLTLTGAPEGPDPDALRRWKADRRALADTWYRRVWSQGAAAAIDLYARPHPEALTAEDLAAVEEAAGRVSWPTVEHRCAALAAAVRRTGVAWDLVVGVSRGGLPVATHLAALLEVPRVAAYGVRFADPERTRVERYSVPGHPEQAKNVLVVEDAVHTGRLLKTVMDHYADNTTARQVACAAVYRDATAPPWVSFTARTVAAIPAMPWEVRRAA